jgi:hypothetical protein
MTIEVRTTSMKAGITSMTNEVRTTSMNAFPSKFNFFRLRGTSADGRNAENSKLVSLA